RPDPFGCIQGVGAGGQGDGDTGSGLAVITGDVVIGLRTEFYPGNVAQLQGGAVGIATDYNLPELFRRFQTALGIDGGVQLLAVNGGRTTQLSHGHLLVLGLDRGDHIISGQPVGIELVGIQPDPHRVLGTEHLHFTHTLHPADRVNQAGVDVVGNVGRVHAAVLG